MWRSLSLALDIECRVWSTCRFSFHLPRFALTIARMPRTYIRCSHPMFLLLFVVLIPVDSQYKCNRERLCLSRCRFNISLDKPSWTIPPTCERKKASSNCAVLMQLDVQRRQIDIFIPHDIRLNLNQTASNMIVQLVRFEFKLNLIQHYIGYLCTQGDDCHWLFVKDKIPSVSKLEDYPTFYDVLAPLVYQSLSTTTTTVKCYQDHRLVDCSNRICAYGPAYASSSWLIHRDCSQNNETDASIYIERRQSDSERIGSTRDLFRFSCNRDQCNSPVNEAMINRTIQNYTQWIIPIEKNAASYRLMESAPILFALMIKTLSFPY